MEKLEHTKLSFPETQICMTRVVQNQEDWAEYNLTPTLLWCPHTEWAEIYLSQWLYFQKF